MVKKFSHKEIRCCEVWGSWWPKARPVNAITGKVLKKAVIFTVWAVTPFC
jgi:hypothetical protein